MSHNPIGHSFTVGEVSFTTRSDTYLNIQKKKENVLFRSSSNESNVNLAYVQSETINSSVNLSIADRSSSLIENRQFTQLQDQILEGVGSFTIETDLFLVTDVFITDVVTQRRLPLFYVHVPNADLGVGETYGDIRVLDYNFNNLTTTNYKIDSVTGFVYSNLQNSFDSTTGIYNLFYITYVIKKTNGVLERYTEILNSRPVFNTAEISDIDPLSGLILPDRKVYILQEDVGSKFIVQLPNTTDYGLRRTSSSRIQIVPPPDTGPDNPWFTRVRNGKFIHTGVTGIKKFRIAEFAVQSFNPYFPYKQIDETSYRVNSRVIKTLRDKVVISAAESIYPEVVVTKEDGTFKFAVTANPARLGADAFGLGFFSNVLLGDSKVAGTGLNASSNGIASSSIDSGGGFIVLPAGYEMSSTDIVRSIYTYVETDYEFTTLDFNPLSSADLLNKRVSLVIRPEPLGTTFDASLYYLIVNEDGLVIDTNIDFTLSGISDIDTTILESGLWYNRDPDTVSWAPSGSIDFVDNYTVEGEFNSADILILGDVYVRNAIRPNSLVINDIRVRGGGLRVGEFIDAAETNPEAAWYWDVGVWDGKPYPGAASFFIEVPVEILVKCGGSLTNDFVRTTANNHIALGTYPVVHGYNVYEPTVTGLNYTQSGVVLTWTSTPPDTYFDIYVAPTEQGPWSVTLSGLTGIDSAEVPLASGMNTFISVAGKKGIDGDICYGGMLEEVDGIIRFIQVRLP